MSADPAVDPQPLTVLRHDGLTFPVHDSGPVTGGGPPIVLLHGFPQTARSWDRVTPILQRAGHRTITIDQRGYAPDNRPRRRRDYRLGALTGDIAALITAIGAEKVHLVGHDWGAAVAWALAAQRPGRVATLTSVSVPHPGALARAMFSSAQALRSYYMLLFQLPYLPERFAEGRPERFAAALRRTGMDDQMIEDVRCDLVDTGALTGGLHWYRAMALSTPGTLTAPVTVPTTHVWSDGDVALTRRSADLAQRYVRGADYRLEVLTGVSHWIPEQAPEALARIILERIARL